MFGKSFIVGLVLQLLLGMAKESLSDPGLKERVKKYVYDIVPGTWMDPVAWALIEALWDSLLLFAGSNTGNSSPKKVAEGVAFVSAEATDYIEKAA